MEAKVKMRQMHCFLDYMRRENKNDELLLRQCISSLESIYNEFIPDAESNSIDDLGI